MSALTPVLMHPKIDSCWIFMPEFLRRVRDFAKDEPWTVRASERFQAAFARGNGEMLGLILVDDTGRARGHVIAGVEMMLGEPYACVYQMHKDKGFDADWTQTTQRCQDLVDGWAMTCGISKCTVSVVDEPRERLFTRFGYTKGPRLLHRDIVRQMAGVLQAVKEEVL